ncbi:DUF3021 domain-containing protein [Paucisalibacillus globulus]|uniref:DUF3021 domain-containing protein n=1 Tax=Paucisalibacillus globulus TaxID=351095 RepID=UPI000478E401|nr:DUF3021 domain-containing protein [Paucisalibacillus globulus]
MIKEVIKRCLVGIAIGGLWTFGVLTFMHVANIEATVSEIWINMLCSFILGIYYGLSSFIFESNDWSILKQTVIHFIMSITIFSIIATSIGWVKINMTSILWTSIIFITIYAIIAICFYRHYKKIEENMNANLEKEE